jgi:segregation and condensation protein A
VAYEVKLEVFEGPIDLLLHLITRQRVDIYDVSLAAITEEFLAAVAEMEAIDLEAATGFLVVAATLLELKSARLLPARRSDDVDSRLLEERDLLLGRLVECATYREAGAHLGAELARGADWHPRDAALEPQFVDLAPDLLARVHLDDVVRAAVRMLWPRPEAVLDTSHLEPIRASVREAIVDVAGQLSEHGARSFTALCEGRTERIEVVVRFLALLELFKAGAIDLEQSDRFGDIVAFWTDSAAVQEAFEEAEEYTVAPEVAG